MESKKRFGNLLFREEKLHLNAKWPVHDTDDFKIGDSTSVYKQISLKYIKIS